MKFALSHSETIKYKNTKMFTQRSVNDWIKFYWHGYG